MKRYYLALLLLCCASISTNLVKADAVNDNQGLYEEEIAASNPIRTEQAHELEAYIAALHADQRAPNPLYKPNYASRAAYVASAKPLRQALQAALGYPPAGKPEAQAPEFKHVGQDSVAQYYRFRISVLPGVHVVGLYIVPNDKHRARNGRLPLVISMHGGGGSPEIATFHGGANYHDLVRGPVARGYAVWAPTHLFSAEGFAPDIRQKMDVRARLVGTTITAIEVAKISRGLDVMLKRPEIDPDRVAMAGLSYGGYYTLYTTALEPRIRVAISSCWFGDKTAMLSSTEPYGWSDVRFAGGLTTLRDTDLVALIAPRPLQVQMGVRDDLIKIETARASAPAAQQPYRALGIADQFELFEGDGGHEFYGDAAWRFLLKMMP